MKAQSPFVVQEVGLVVRPFVNRGTPDAICKSLNWLGE